MIGTNAKSYNKRYNNARQQQNSGNNEEKIDSY